jgi:hypothetical protein
MADELYPSDFAGYYYGGDESGADASYPSDFGGYWYGEEQGYGYDTGYTEEPFNYEPGIYYPQEKYAAPYGGGNVESVSTGWKPTTYSSTGTAGGKSVGGGGSTTTTRRPYLTGTTNTTTYIGGGALPTMSSPTYNLPAYDYGRINYLAQQQAAPLYTKARNALYTGMGKIAATDNPYMQGQARKQLMSGYGGGLSDIAAGAARTGAQLYAPEYAGQIQKATSEYGGQLATAQSNFQAALAEWQKSLKTVTTTDNMYSYL